MGRFVQNGRTARVCDLLELRLSPFLHWEKALEDKAVGGKPRDHQRRYKGRRPGETLHVNAPLDTGTYQEIAGVGDSRCPSVGDECHFALCLDTLADAIEGLMLIELMVALHRTLDIEVLK